MILVLTLVEKDNVLIKSPKVLADNDHAVGKKSDISETSLWNDFKSGSEISFSTIYKNFYSQLFNYGRQFQKDTAVVEDAIQDLFVDLWNSRNTLGEIKTIKYYLYKSLRRRIFLKNQKMHLFQSALGGTSEMFPIELSVESQIIETESESSRLFALNRVLSELTARQREIIYLKYYENFSFQEIAGMLNLSVENTYKFLSRAIAALKKNLTEYKI